MAGTTPLRRTHPPVPRLLPAALGCALAALLLVFPAPARAQPEVQVTPWAGIGAGGGFRDSATGDALAVGESAAFGLILDLLERPRAYYELSYSFQSTRLGGFDTPGAPREVDLDIHYLHLGGTYEYPGGTAWPFLAAGLGATALVPSGDGRDTSVNFSVSLGGGVKIPLSDRVGLRLEGRGYLTFISESAQIFCVSSGGGGGCAAGVQGDSFGQIAVLAGISFRL